MKTACVVLSLIYFGWFVDDSPPKEGAILSFGKDSSAWQMRLLPQSKTQSISQSRREFFTKLFAQLDRDRNQSLSIDEAKRIPSALTIRQYLWGYFLASQAHAPEFASIDTDSNRTISLDELVAYYRKAGLGDLLVAFGTSIADSQLDRALLKKLDRDNDGIISTEEIRTIEKQLRELDINADELVAADELVSGLVAPYPFATRLLHGETDQRLPIRLSTEATRSMAFEIHFDPESGQFNQLIEEKSISSANHLAITQASTRIDFRSMKGSLPIRFAEHRAAQHRRFEEADANRDLTLDATELKSLPLGSLSNLMQLADTDENGQLTRKELDVWLDLQELLVKSHLQVSILHHGQSLFAGLDTNRDGCLSIPELREAEKRFPDPSNRPQIVQIILSCGQPIASTNVDFKSTTIPDWFKKMDANNDGVISRNEFLGTKEKFKQLDQNQDGLIDTKESK